jgi:hypothetical protein
MRHVTVRRRFILHNSTMYRVLLLLLLLVMFKQDDIHFDGCPRQGCVTPGVSELWNKCANPQLLYLDANPSASPIEIEKRTIHHTQQDPRHDEHHHRRQRPL